MFPLPNELELGNWCSVPTGMVWFGLSCPDPQSAQPSLRNLTGLGAPRCHSLKACGLLTAPEPWGGTPEREMPPVCSVCGVRVAGWVKGGGCGVVCRLVLQALGGR